MPELSTASAAEHGVPGSHEAAPGPSRRGVSDLTSSIWGRELDVVVCEACDWSYLVPRGDCPPLCPNCFQGGLIQIDGYADEAPHFAPELVVPFSAPEQRVAENIQGFAKRIPFAPHDLTSENLARRLRRIFLPQWLVDVDVSAEWQAEMGFDYQAVTHEDHYSDVRGGWTSQEVKETRVRWEPRLGRLLRAYNNLSAPAMEESREFEQRLGRYDTRAVSSYESGSLAQSSVRLPGRSPEDAWPDAIPELQARAAEECHQAAGADHVREFRWRPTYKNPNWTCLLLPLYTTYYLDDENTPQPVHIHGQTGLLFGRRKASMKRAERLAMVLAITAAVLLVLSLVTALASMLLPALFTIGVVGAILAVCLAPLALVPLGIVWQFNRK